ncbi:MAG TPA: hypothetical protein VIP05_09805 [Burkholderiaceae bacterium]
MDDDTGLRWRRPKSPNVLYSIEVRGRPVQVAVVGHLATHVYLVLLNAANEVCESLSFDPSCSNGWSDNSPTDISRGSQVVATGCTYEVWQELRHAYKAYVVKHDYSLGSHNCCHAVMAGLSGSRCPDAAKGISFARIANNTFFNLTGNLTPEEFSKKND